MTTFPSTYSTTTTTTTTSTSHDDSMYVNTAYFRTQHGMIKILQIVTCLLAFICVMSAGTYYNSLPDANYISFVSVGGIIISAVLFFLYFINAVVFLTSIPWVFVEFIYNAMWCFFSFVGGIVGAVYSSKHSVGDAAYGASAFFLFVAMCLYGFYAFKLYVLHNQGVRLVVVSSETITTRTIT